MDLAQTLVNGKVYYGTVLPFSSIPWIHSFNQDHGVLETVPTAMRWEAIVHPDEVASPSEATHIHSHTHKGKLPFTINQRCMSLRSHWSSQRKPMQTLGEHVKWTQKGPFLMRGDHANQCTTKLHGLFFCVQVMSFHLLYTVLYVGESCNGGSKVFHLRHNWE